MAALIQIGLVVAGRGALMIGNHIIIIGGFSQGVWEVHYGLPLGTKRTIRQFASFDMEGHAKKYVEMGIYSLAWVANLRIKTT